MSIHAINQYHSEVEKIIHFGGTKKETAIRNAFYHLLHEYAKQKGLMLVPEVTIKTAKGKNVTPDGTLKDSLRQDWGYWESKDEADDINEEIKKKFAKGYPSDNILFEDSNTAVLIQNGAEVQRVKMKKAEDLDRIIHSFINFERPEVKNFRKAIELFKQDIPKVTDTLRDMLDIQEKANTKFVKERNKFLKLCHDSINPEVTKADVREMIIQHILTEDIFNTIFDETQFHRENNIARQLEGVINTFFTGATKRTALSTLQHYSQAINAAAAGIADHHEKQKFLKVVYETFYKSYNPKAADRLGVVYTPNEIVKFMIESTDYLLHKHFGKFLEDKGVEILDPATGTGTFICDIIDYIRKEKLEYKYINEIHANEVAILPYYISNLNIEFTYKQKMGKYAEFENLCFMDTLDNMGFAYRGKQIDLFAPFTEENSKRIYKQNTKKISVVIGNPPYNAKQASANDNNENRKYPEIDKRIKSTYIKESKAQNNSQVYDPYVKFFRWASDRISENGIISFISNSSYISQDGFDGFRKTIQHEFDYAYIIDSKGDVRANPKIAGTTHNVFGIQTGVSIIILIKKAKQNNSACQIHYIALDDFWRKEQKLQWFVENKFNNIPFEHIQPDSKYNWINIGDLDFYNLIPLIEKKKIGGKSIFNITSLGVQTKKDDWIFDFNKDNLLIRMKYFTDVYNKCVPNCKGKKEENIKSLLDYSISWDRELRKNAIRGRISDFSKDKIIECEYRPFTKHFFYNSEELIAYKLSNNKIYSGKNKAICITIHTQVPFVVQASNKLIESGYGSRETHSVPIFRYDENGKQIENITDWGLNQFVKQYGKKGISKEAIFHYVYAVLHNPAYRKKYELNLKREFPRIPFYKDFKKWTDWGKDLMELHLNYEKAKPYSLFVNTDNTIIEPKCKLKADKENGVIIIDEATIISKIPTDAWDYKLGNRSALEWVLDQYKEKKPSDPTILEKFNTYKFADYKEQVIDLLKRVSTVSVETMKIINEMNKVIESK